MNSSSLFSPDGNFFHHAYLIIGEHEPIKTNLFHFLKKAQKAEPTSNPDFVFFDHQSLGVDESRAISAAQIKKPVNGEYNFFFISFQTATFEAQNSLLKVFEDPSPHNIFFIITKNEPGILPTLKSRLYKVQYTGIETLTDTVSKKFLNSSKAERVALVKEIIERKDKKEVLDFLSNIETTLHTFWQKNKYPKELSGALKEIAKARDFVQDRASSLKLLLEHISLVIPQI